MQSEHSEGFLNIGIDPAIEVVLPAKGVPYDIPAILAGAPVPAAPESATPKKSARKKASQRVAK